MKRNCLIYIVFTITLLLASCRSQPDYVIDKDRMVDLMIDVHKTEAVINLNYSSYPTDEKKRAMRKAVYMRHNITEAEFDSSMIWYGHHLDVYMEIYDEVIKRLKEEDAEIKKLIAEENVQVLTQEGDTVDIWKQERWHIFNPNKGENILAFNIDKDDNFKRRDHFTLRFHTLNVPSTGQPITVYIAARHNNHLIHYNSATIKEGWNSINVQSDSINHLSEIYGYIAMPPRKDRHIMYVDSIELIRIHNKASMPIERFNAITITNKKQEEKKDKTDVKAIKPTDEKSKKEVLRNKITRKKIDLKEEE